MLTLTENASHVVKTLTDQNTEGEQAGLRISAATGTPGELGLAAVETPEPGDQVLEAEGARLYLEEQAAVALDDQVLDAVIDEGGGVQFAVAPQD